MRGRECMFVRPRKTFAGQLQHSVLKHAGPAFAVSTPSRTSFGSSDSLAEPGAFYDDPSMIGTSWQMPWR